MTMPITTLHYLYTPKREDRWLAHCLDLDIIAAGKSADEAESRLDALVRVHVRNVVSAGSAGSFSTEAPEEFWTAFSQAMTDGRCKPSLHSVFEATRATEGKPAAPARIRKFAAMAPGPVQAHV